MYCNCNEFAFIYTIFCKENEKFVKYKISKCNRLEIDKKKPCNYYNKEKIHERIHEKNTNTISNTSENCNKDYKSISTETQLNFYIKLVKLCKERNCNYNNYLARINYYLNMLNYKLFFEDKETIENLELRLKRPPDNIKIKIKNKKLILIDVPENLKPFSKSCKSCKSYKYSKNKSRNNKNYNSIIYTFSKRCKDEDDNDEEDLSESEDGFDMENNYSDLEEENEDIVGYFSD